MTFGIYQAWLRKRKTNSGSQWFWSCYCSSPCCSLHLNMQTIYHMTWYICYSNIRTNFLFFFFTFVSFFHEIPGLMPRSAIRTSWKRLRNLKRQTRKSFYYYSPKDITSVDKVVCVLICGGGTDSWHWQRQICVRLFRLRLRWLDCVESRLFLNIK